MVRKRGRPSRPELAIDTQAILHIAGDLFMTHGYSGVSLEVVAAQAGVDKKSLYYHFGNKSRLFGEAVTLFLKSRREVLESVMARPVPARERFREVARRALALGPQMHWYRLTVREAGPALGDAHTEGVRAERAVIGEVLARALADAAKRGEISPDIPVDMAAEAFLHLIAAAQDPAVSQIPDSTRADWVVALLWDGLGKA